MNPKFFRQVFRPYLAHFLSSTGKFPGLPRFIVMVLIGGLIGGCFSCTCPTYPAQISTTLVITSPNHPSNYPTDCNCAWIFDTDPGKVFQIQFQSLALASNDDNVHIIDSALGFRPLWCRLASVSTCLSTTVNTTQNEVKITFRTSATTPGHDGYSISINAIPDPKLCHEHYDVTDEVSFTSSNYPSSYDFSKTCYYWFHTAPGCFLTLEFPNFEIENCCDRLFIFDGNTTEHQRISTCQGSGCSATETSDNSLLVVFGSDFGGNRVGFQGLVKKQCASTTASAAMTSIESRNCDRYIEVPHTISNTGIVLLSNTTADYRSCARFCLMNSWCQSFQFQTSSGFCQLTDRNPKDEPSEFAGGESSDRVVFMRAALM